MLADRHHRSSAAGVGPRVLIRQGKGRSMMQQRSSVGRAQAVIASTVTGLVALTLAALAQSPKIGDPPEAKNMRLVGYNDLQARSAYQPTIHHQGDRYIAYVGHHGGTVDVPKPMNRLTGQPEDSGTSIVDVSDPAQPRYLAHIPGLPGESEQGGAQMVRVCDGKTLPNADASKTYMLRVFGGRAHEMWDVTDPANPTLVTTIVQGLKDTHKSWWECDTGIAYLVSGVEGWRVRRMTQVFDLSDPAKPVHIRDFGLVGQEPGASGAVPTDLHGPISTGPQGNRVYFGYGTNKGGVLQIVDREKLLNGPKEPTPDNLRYPEVGRLDLLPFNGAHTVFPMSGVPIAEFARDKDGKVREFVMIVDEQILSECQEARQLVWFVDVTVEAKPMVVANFQVPEASGNFCQRGGRFGAHSSNESMAPVFYKKVAFVTYFNAGVRAIDIRDPFKPRKERCKVAIQTNNLEVDDRGYIYIVDRANTGMHILQVTGEARKIANF